MVKRGEASITAFLRAHRLRACATAVVLPPTSISFEWHSLLGCAMSRKPIWPLHAAACPTPLSPSLPFRAIRESAFGTVSPAARPVAEASQEVADESVWRSAVSRAPFSVCQRGARASAPHPWTRRHPRNQSGCREYALRSLRLDCRALMMRIVSLPCPNLRIV